MHSATLKNTGSHSVLLSVANTADKKRVNNKAPNIGALLFYISICLVTSAKQLLRQYPVIAVHLS
jgi:hypothetical protein